MLLNEGAVSLGVDLGTPREAIQYAGELMVRQGAVTPDYVQAMIDAYHTLGPYIVLAPGIAMPHARPEAGALAESIAFVRLTAPIEFGHPDNDPVRLVIPLAGVDAAAHIKTLQAISTVLMDPANIDVLFETNDVSEIARVFNDAQRK